MPKKPTSYKTVEALKHDEAKRKNIPSAEQQSIIQKEVENPKTIRYQRNTDLDPQLVWRGKDEQDWSDLVVHAPPLYIQEKVHPKALIDDLLRQTKEAKHDAGELTADLFADFNGIPKGADKTEFYQHDQNWSNRMILGDSLQVMASLAEREGLRGKVQCIYFDPPYGIKFNSNFQWSTTSRDVKDGNAGHITREPEQVKAFRDTWRDGIHSYLTYLRDRLTVARDLLTDSGSIFVQIGDENVHRIRALMDEVFGEDNFVCQVAFAKTTATSASLLPTSGDFLVWYAKCHDKIKYRQQYVEKSNQLASYNISENRATGEWRKMTAAEVKDWDSVPKGWSIVSAQNLRSQGVRANTTCAFEYQGRSFHSGPSHNWKTTMEGVQKLIKANRLILSGTLPNFKRYVEDFPVVPVSDSWDDTAIAGFSGEDKLYIVQTATKVIERCILMTTDPGDLVLDPTCGSGTTATVAEQWGRRWITIDTSRVALALARARIMGARYPFYLLADSEEGRRKNVELRSSGGGDPSTFNLQPSSFQNNIRHGFVYERVPHITLKSIANNAEIDVIWDQWQKTLEPLRVKLNAALGTEWQEWEIPREFTAETTKGTKFEKLDSSSRTSCASWLKEWWEARITRQQEIDKSIAAKAEFEYLYDKPYEEKKKVRVAGPFTVESLSPHRMLGVDEDGDTLDPAREDAAKYSQSFPAMILENLRMAGVQQAHKEDRITFTSLVPWPGEGRVCAVGTYLEGEAPSEPTSERRAGIFIGPEFGTVQRADLVEAARECGDAGFDVLIACAFNYEAHATEFGKLGRIPVLKARMNADLHMAADLKNTGKGNLFVIFGEPDIDLLTEADGRLRVKVNGVDVFKPQTGEVVSDGADGIACWFIDTDYNGESFFVRHAYFLGQNDPYTALKTTLKAEINADAWATLNSDTSRPFEKPKTGRIAVKVINHLGDEVMKVFRVG
jgi:adenine-specific DNA-methyltransferase